MGDCVLIPVISLLLKMYSDTVLRIAKARDKVTSNSSHSVKLSPSGEVFGSFYFPFLSFSFLLFCGCLLQVQ